MAILDPRYAWAIDQVLPLMLAELRVVLPVERDAALFLAKRRARQLLLKGEDPLLSLNYFYRLTWLADYPSELIPLAYLEDEFEFQDYSPLEARNLATQYLEELLDPELAERRGKERQSAWESQQKQIRNDWPYIFDSPGRHSLLRLRLREKFKGVKLKVLLILIGASLLWGWSIDSWSIALAFICLYSPLLLGLAYWAEYRRLKRERRDILLRRNIPEDQI